MWFVAARLAPTAAAIHLIQAGDCKRKGHTVLRCRPCANTTTHCIEKTSSALEKGHKPKPVQRVKTGTYLNKANSASVGTSLMQPMPQSSTKALLGDRNWIFRLQKSANIADVYDIGRELGQGSFGTVFLGRHKGTGYPRAVKFIAKSEDAGENEKLMIEIYTLMDLDHPHIIHMEQTFEDAKYIYVVSELCSGPDLFDRLADKEPMTEQEMGVALRHMLKAVRCCHSHYKGHYDIKPENFMFSDAGCTLLKMIDLGMSSGFNDNVAELNGSVEYMAPEVLHGMYGPPADMWGCGIVLFVMAIRDLFCPGKSDEEIAACLQDRRWVKERLTWASERVSPDCFDLLSRMLCYDRHMRISAADAMRHPFIQNTYAKHTHGHETRDGAIAVIISMADRFAEFGAEPLFVRAALLLMAHITGYMHTETQPHRLAYSMLDRVGSGELSMDSMEAVLPKYIASIPPSLDNAFRAVDLNRDGYIAFGSFLAATLPQGVRCREDLCRNVFTLMDQNQDGFIDDDDLATALLSKEDVNNDYLRDLCHRAIIEVSGSSKRTRLDFDSFLHIVSSSRH